MLEKLRQLPRFLQALAGARQEVLAQCPAEAVKFESLGWSILITCGMGTVSMWFALSTAMGINGIIAIFPALAWGLVIMGIDRWLITSMPHDGKRKLLVAAPRLLMAFLLGTLISTPFVLRIFESEINAQISVIKENNYNNFVAQQQSSTVGAQVTSWTGQVNSLQAEIDSGGAKTVNPATDPTVKTLTTQRSNEQQVASQDFKTWQCQLYGVYDGVACPKGNGPLAQASENAYYNAEATIKQLNTSIQNRVNSLNATSVAADKQRYDQAEQALPNALYQLHTAQTREDNLRNAFNASNDALNGILVRLEALSQLSNGNFTVTAARFLVFLLFLVIEILPVTVKVMQRPGPYEELYEQMQQSYLKKAKKVGFRMWTPDGDGHATDGALVIRGYAEPAGESLHDLFQGKTKVLPRGFDGTSPDRQPTEVLRGGIGFQQSGNRVGQDGYDDNGLPQGGYRDSEFQQFNGRRDNGFQRGRTSRYPNDGYLRDSSPQNGNGAAPTRHEGYLAWNGSNPAPTRRDPNHLPPTIPGGRPGDPARPDGPGAHVPNPVTDSGGLSLMHQGLLNMNDNRPPADSGSSDSGELNWDEG
jgi:hypothetical protein